MVNSKKITYRDLSKKAGLRKLILDAYLDKKMDRESAKRRLRVTERQFIRIVKAYKLKGISSLIHGLCNKPSNHSYPEEFKQTVTSQYKDRYDGFNYTHASEKLEELDNIIIHPNTLRNWLLSSGISRRKYGKKSYYKRREPRKQFGELVQMDGSFHDWFGDGKQYCLMHMVDDATKTSLSMLSENETTDAALAILYKWCELYGIPEAIYSDRDGVYKVNEQHARLTIEEELEGKTERLTVFGKVCKRLEIKQIYAYSAQAKGRVERKHQMYQDRLVKEIKLFSLKNMDEVNNFLLTSGGFTQKLNAKFTIAPSILGSCIKLPKSKLCEYFTIDEYRIVRNDYTIQFKNKVFQLNRHLRLRPKTRVTIKTYMNGKIAIFANRYRLEYTLIEDYQCSVDKVAQAQITMAKVKLNTEPSISPWRTFTAKKSTAPVSKKQVMQNLDYIARRYE